MKTLIHSILATMSILLLMALCTTGYDNGKDVIKKIDNLVDSVPNDSISQDSIVKISCRKLNDIAKIYNIEVATIKAVSFIEAGPEHTGFIKYGSPIVHLEVSMFKKMLQKAGYDAMVYSGKYSYFPMMDVESLREMGYSEQLAQERTLAAMGDPAEVGRELNRQYTGWGWVISGRIAKLVAVLLVVPLLCSPFLHDRWMGPNDYIKNRIDPDFSGTTQFLEYAARSDFSPDAPAPDMTPLWDGAESVLPLDIHLQVGNDELRVFRVSVGETEDWDTGRIFLAAEVLAVAYDQIPFGLVSSWVLGEMTLTSQDGAHTAWCGDLIGQDGRLLCIQGTVEIQPGDTYVTLSQDRFGQKFSLRIPLPEVAP